MPSRPIPGGARPIAAVALAVASLVAAAAVGSIFLTSARDAWSAIAAPGPAGPADGILLVVALGGAGLTLWLGLGTALSALSALPGALGQACGAMAARIAPAAVRKVVAFVLGTALTAALVPGTALARTENEAPRPAVVASAQHDLPRVTDLPDAAPDASFRFVSDSLNDTDAAPSPSWSARQPASGVSPTNGRDDVVVLRGDSLWSIAARHLGPAATNTEIDAEWPTWFAVNRHVIGNDPNLIKPGQRLSPPPPPRGDR